MKYHGVCITEEHAPWAQNVISLEAIRVICDSEPKLHSETLSEMLVLEDMWEFPTIRGTLFWGAYKKDPVV